MRAVVVAAGSAGDAPWVRRCLRGAALVVAADGGARAVWAVGKAPDVVVGDLDSLDPATRAALAGAGAAFDLHPREKDETDLELALRLAVERGATEIDVLAALGGDRLDHELGNVLALTLPLLTGRRVTLRHPRHDVSLLRGPAGSDIAGRQGDLVSLLPLSEHAEGITTEGLRYALAEGTLTMGRTRGVSNELTGERATVRLRAGLLLVVHHRPRRARR